jgi:hypothetical protein
MSRLAPLAGAALVLLSACETTGDPQRGGLFGWSEAKAQGRQHEKQSHVAGAATDLAHETARGETLEQRDQTTQRHLSTAETRHALAEKNLRVQQAALVTKIERLEAESPTPATASRSRSYRVKASTIVEQSALPAAQRAQRLRSLETEVDAALAQFNQ